MGCSRAYHDDIDRIEGGLCAILVSDLDLMPRGERGSRLLSKHWINLDCGYAACCSSKFGGDCCVVAGPATEMEDVIASLDLDMVEKICP